MALPSSGPARLQLPARIRNKKTLSDEFQTRLAFIDRIADLPLVRTVETGSNTIPRQVDVYVTDDFELRRIERKAIAPRFLCSLSVDGIAINGLDSWAHHQVVSRGWGRLISNHVLVFLPRDPDELEIAWGILRQAYDNLMTASSASPAPHFPSAWDLPKFSRTTLQ